MRERATSSIPDRRQTPEASPADELPFSQDLINLIYGIGNHEVKSLVVLAMMHNPNKAHGSADFYESFLTLTKDRRFRSRKLRYLAPIMYCERSLEKAKIVEAIPSSPLLQDETIYRLTEFGREEAFSFAGHVLDFSLHHDISLLDLLGQTHNLFSDRNKNMKKPSPITRLEVLKALSNANMPLRTVEVAKMINDSGISNTRTHLRDLARSNTISYESTNPGETEVITKYRLSTDEIRTSTLPREKEFPPYRTLSQQIYDLVYRSSLDGRHFLTRDITANILIARYPEIARMSRVALVRRIGKVFAHFHKEGLVDKVGDSSKRSDIKITQKQKRAISRFITLLNEFQEGDSRFIEKGKRKAIKIMNDPESVKILMDKGTKKSSPDSKTTKAKIIKKRSKNSAPKLFPRGEEWRAESACADIHTDVFFPLAERKSRKADDELEIREQIARNVCRICSARTDCLTYSLNTNQEWGIWGGLNFHERNLIRPNLPKANETEPPTPNTF